MIRILKSAWHSINQKCIALDEYALPVCRTGLKRAERRNLILYVQKHNYLWNLIFPILFALLKLPFLLLLSVAWISRLKYWILFFCVFYTQHLLNFSVKSIQRKFLIMTLYCALQMHCHPLKSFSFRLPLMLYPAEIEHFCVFASWTYPSVTNMCEWSTLYKNSIIREKEWKVYTCTFGLSGFRPMAAFTSWLYLFFYSFDFS